MARPRKFDEKLTTTSVSVLPSTCAAVKSVAADAGVSESEVWRTALEAGLPLVPKKLAKKRRDEARKAKSDDAKKKDASNVVPIASLIDSERKPTSGFEPLTYGLRNRCPSAEVIPLRAERDASLEIAVAVAANS